MSLQNDIAIRRMERADLGQLKVKWPVRGRICDVVGTVIEAVLPGIQVGSLVSIESPRVDHPILAEVVGFRDEKVLMLPFQELSGVAPGAAVGKFGRIDDIAVGDYLLGKVVDPFMNCLNFEGFEAPAVSERVPIDRLPPNPLLRSRIHQPLSLGVRAIDSTLTFGDGQRVGIMAGSGVGKSVLMGMIARSSDADVNVIGLIGERGREVREFIERDLGAEGLARSVVIVVTSEHSPLMKVRAAKMVHSVAEYFSSQGQRVLLMMDSLTRTAMAQREIGLAVGEPPTTKGYTPSVFSLLPRLLERSGPQPAGHGSISALYTVLVDGDDFNDPIADAARSILDGQINLTRRLASKGHFPAIDVSTSVSRVMLDIVTERHKKLALRLKNLMGVYEENIDLVQIGAYQPGSNSTLDEAIRLMPLIDQFLKQDVNERSTLMDAVDKLEGLVGGMKS